MRTALRHATRVAYLICPGLLIVSTAWCIQHELPWNPGENTLSVLALASPSVVIVALTIVLFAVFRERTFFLYAPLVSFAIECGLFEFATRSGLLPFGDACHMAPVAVGLFLSFILQVSTLCGAFVTWLAIRKGANRPPET
jgi:hypothetical protein